MYKILKVVSQSYYQFLENLQGVISLIKLLMVFHCIRKEELRAWNYSFECYLIKLCLSLYIVKNALDLFEII